MSARIVIAGGGLAGIEAALGLRELASADAEITIVAPARELAHQALDAPWTMSGIVRHPLDEVCARLGVTLVRDAIASVDVAARSVALQREGSVAYDALLVAVGARRVMSLDHAVVFGSALDVPAVERLRDLVQGGDARRVAFIVPPGAAWSLPAYEGALRAADAGAESVVVTSEPRPLDIFGSASSQVAEVLAAAGVTVVHGTAVDTEPGTVVLADDTRVHADAIVAQPWVRGPRVEGLPHDDDGFLPTDPWCAVDGASGVWGAGDGTVFPIRQGGLACQQAAVAAASIAAAAGADVPVEPLRPVVRGALPTPSGALWLEHDLSSGEARSSDQPLWDPPSRIAGVRLPAFLASLS
ncbi:MAG TPA: FAD-dependent oxidoreductase [Solirubrobacteraceae bacterium]|nr:FAD-dependent oxidoreductase [Solirubrobacteraceae bacterium]